ncbi:MAG: 3-deoxy-manno-octulosonate cytidylyltransferase [Gammaproteobacteria bacterium]|nr:3-deoxy-manno-octulosonate cytidylyltransferase [Gammaproteobacteria bacterium]
MTGFVVVIPARYASTRLPGKALRDLGGKPMLQHVYERGCESAATDVVVATDDNRIADVAAAFGATVCMTGNQHQSGTERIAEVADLLDWDDDQVVVNLQGDEPAMPAALIDQCATLLDDASVDIATLASPLLSEEDFDNPNIVKVIRDEHDHAIYFSRTAIPYARDSENRQRSVKSALHHHGIYAYRCGVLRRFVAAEPSDLEVCEQLEQLRALSLGMTIAVGVPAIRPGIGIDTEEDLRRAERDFSS